MPPPNQSAVLDGVSVITKGMHSGVSPRLLPADQLAWAVNITNRHSLPRTRPVWKKVALVYESTATQTLATEGLFQGASFHLGFNGQENVLVASIAGHLFRYLVGTTRLVQDISIPGDLNSPVAPQTWQWQSEDFTIIQNGLANPLFFDGAVVRRSLGWGGLELPAGTVGAYVQGRNWTALQNRIAYIASDLVYSSGGGGPYNGRDAVLRTTENTFLSGGGAFAVPVTAGPITAMSSVSIPDTSLGQGPLLVTTSNSIFSIQVPLDRVEWANTQYPLITIGLPSHGPLSQWSSVVVNGDLWYRAFDGLRSYTVARRDFNTWVNTPLSIEMGRVMRSDTESLLAFSSGVLFDNRLLVTCSPYPNTCRGVAHRGLIALDYNNISSLTERSNPAYDGLWTGLPILRVLRGTFNGVERCFAFALDNCTRICLYELLPDGAAQFDYDGESYVGVESVLETRSLTFGDGGNKLKQLKCADLFLDKLAGPADGQVLVNFQYKSDEHPIWQAWHEFALCAPQQQCSREACDPLQNIWPSYRTLVRLPEPADTCNPVTSRQMRTGYEFQVRLAWTGYAQLNRMLVWSLLQPESLPSSCPSSETCRLLVGCDEDPFTYQIEQSECAEAVTDCVTGEEGFPSNSDSGGGGGGGGDSPSVVDPAWPDYPVQPTGWPTPQPPWTPTETWPPTVQIMPPMTPAIQLNAPPYFPVISSCTGTQQNDFSWQIDTGAAQRRIKFSGGTASDDPNTFFSAALIRWYYSHLVAYFSAQAVAQGLTYDSFQAYWDYDTGSENWNAETLYEFDSTVQWFLPGWTIKIAYCSP